MSSDALPDPGLAGSSADETVAMPPVVPGLGGDASGSDAGGPGGPGGSGSARRGRPRRWLQLTAVGVIVAVGLVYGAGAAAANGRTPRNATVDGVQIGGMTHDEAVATLAATLDARASLPITVDAAGTKATVDPKAAGLALDLPGTVTALDATSWNPVTVLKRLFGQTSAPLLRNVDTAKLTSAVVDLKTKLDASLRQASVRFQNGEPVGVEPVSGRTVDASAAADAIKNSWLNNSGAVSLPTTVTKPATTQAQLDAALAMAKQAVSGPISLHAGSQTIVVPPTAIAAALSFTAAADGSLSPTIDAHAIRVSAAGEFESIETKPKDATFVIVANKPKVVPAVDGTKVGDSGLSAAVLAAMSADGTARTAVVALEPVSAALTTAKATALGVTTLISTFTQNFPYAAYRKQNIGTAARYINGTLLLPGQTFSENGTIHERTVANGYTVGTIIAADGRFAEDLGGGVSTITTAMWHAVFYAGLQRVEQRAHSFWISRYQPGLEATVSWGSLDLKFKNDSPYGVLISAISGDNFVTISIWSTKRYDVTAVSEPEFNILPVTKFYDPTPTCIPQSGEPGFSIVVNRVFSINGKVVKTEPLRTNYVVQQEVFCGPDPSKSPTPTTSPTPGRSPTPSKSPTPGHSPTAGKSPTSTR